MLVPTKKSQNNKMLLPSKIFLELNCLLKENAHKIVNEKFRLAKIQSVKVLLKFCLYLENILFSISRDSPVLHKILKGKNLSYRP